MKPTCLSLCAAALLILSQPLNAQLTFYDPFNGSAIDPAKWLAPPMCSGGFAYDCGREIQYHQLRLAVRNYADNGIDTGVSFDRSPLSFRNPNSIWAMRMLITVNRFSSAACSTNAEAAHPQLLMFGSFFNVGPADPSGDLQAYFMIERRTDDPSLPSTELRVGGFLRGPSGFFDNVDLGTVRVNEPVVASLVWDKANKQFIAQVVHPFSFFQTSRAVMPYSFADDAPPAVAFKQMDVGAFVPNCTSAPTFGAMEAHFGYVQVNEAAASAF